MSMDDIHLWQNWTKWDIALVLKNLTEQWLSCLLGLGWLLGFFSLVGFFRVWVVGFYFLSFKARTPGFCLNSKLLG